MTTPAVTRRSRDAVLPVPTSTDNDQDVDHLHDDHDDLCDFIHIDARCRTYRCLGLNAPKVVLFY